MSFKILDTFYENGGNFIDTANNYQNGDSEAWLGDWMEARGVRDEIVLATKYTSPWRMFDKSQVQANYVGNNAKSLKVSVDASLRKLKTDYIDLVSFITSTSYLPIVYANTISSCTSTGGTSAPPLRRS
jgi:aryl-alcohol dehydrogenase-like predicted oxidoreductase